MTSCETGETYSWVMTSMTYTRRDADNRVWGFDLDDHVSDAGDDEGCGHADLEDPDGNGGIDFWGNSFVCGPQGEYLARADRDQEQTLVVDLDMARSEEVRRIWPYLRDRRVDAYQDLTKRYRD